jgi:hypothetical protein
VGSWANTRAKSVNILVKKQHCHYQGCQESIEDWMGYKLVK